MTSFGNVLGMCFTYSETHELENMQRLRIKGKHLAICQNESPLGLLQKLTARVTCVTPAMLLPPVQWSVSTAWCESTQPPEWNNNYKEAKDLSHMSAINVTLWLLLYPTVSTAPAPKSVSLFFKNNFFSPNPAVWGRKNAFQFGSDSNLSLSLFL